MTLARFLRHRGPTWCAILRRMVTSEGGKRRAPGAAAGSAWRPRVGWLTAAVVVAAVAINLAGIGAIAVAQRGVFEETRRLLRLEAEARAGTLEGVLASIRADLAFLTGSPIFFGLESALGSRDPREARWRRLEAEGALLLFLRGHPEASHLAARSADGAVLVAAGRRGGIPVLWKPGDVPAIAQAADSPEPAADGAGRGGRAITGRFEFKTGVRKVSGAVVLEATLDAGRLLALQRPVDDRSRGCILLDARGNLLGSDAGSAAPPTARADGDGMHARA